MSNPATDSCIEGLTVLCSAKAQSKTDACNELEETTLVKTLAGLMFVLGISFFANAAAGQWAFNFRRHTGGYIALDVLLGLACWLLSWLLWAWHTRRSVLRGLS
jgi:hypothetical protein